MPIALIYNHIFCDIDNKFFINLFYNCLSSNFTILTLNLIFSALIILFLTLSSLMYYFNESVLLRLSISDYMLM